MLQRATSGLYSPNRWANWRRDLVARGLLAGPASLLLKYVAVLALATVIGCLYLWQASHLRDLQMETARLRNQRITLEQANVNLVNQLALWNNPAYIDGRSKAEGYQPPQSHITVDLEAKDTLAQSAVAPSAAGVNR
jgi:hypothetical protein